MQTLDLLFHIYFSDSHQQMRCNCTFWVMHIYAADKILKGDPSIELRRYVCASVCEDKKWNCYWKYWIWDKNGEKYLHICVRNCLNELQFITDCFYCNSKECNSIVLFMLFVFTDTDQTLIGNRKRSLWIWVHLCRVLFVYTNVYD